MFYRDLMDFMKIRWGLGFNEIVMRENLQEIRVFTHLNISSVNVLSSEDGTI
jgi:hypothetical protein